MSFVVITALAPNLDGVDAPDARQRSTTSPSHAPAMDEDQVAELYRRHGPAIFSHCRRLLRSTVAARDATQETFIRMLAKAPRHLGPEDLLRYLYRISTNVCINQLREAQVRVRAQPTLLARTLPPSQDGGIAARDFAAALLQRCDELGAEIAVLHHIDGLSQVEIAQLLRVTRRTVYNRLRKIEDLAHQLMESVGDANAKDGVNDKVAEVDNDGNGNNKIRER